MRGKSPSEFFTREYLKGRKRPPKVLFHFTRKPEHALAILEGGHIKGFPVLSVTENPALAGPTGPVFVLDVACLERKGVKLVPHEEQAYSPREAEWRTGSFEVEGKIPISCVTQVGWSYVLDKRQPEKAAKLREAAEKRGIEAVSPWDWTKHWTRGSVDAAFAKPHDAWKHVKKGKLEVPDEFIGHEKLWRHIARKKLGVDPGKGVHQLPPVIGGRRRYHHRPLTTWKLPGRGGSVTFTPDEMEAKSWNRMKSKRHPAMPVIYNVFEIRRRGKKKVWAIQHATLAWPPDHDWYLFIDTFFRWRAMQHDALKPAEPYDVQEFLEFIMVPDVSDERTIQRRRAEDVLPFKVKHKRRTKIDKVREQVWDDPGLMTKVKWAKSTIAFLKNNKVKHRDLDPSNLGKTMRGKTVVTNIAESRSRGGKTGRVGRVSGGAPSMPLPVNESGSPFGPSTVAPLLRTAQACEHLLDPEAPLLESVHIFSGGDRRTYGLIHMCRHKRAVVLEAAFKIGFDPETLKRGMDKLSKFAMYHGGKARKIHSAVSSRMGGNVSASFSVQPLDAAPIIATLTHAEIAEALSRMLDESNVTEASNPQRRVLTKTAYRDRDLRTALFLASNNLPATVVQGWLGVRAIRGMAKLAYLSEKSGGQAAKLYPKVQAMLDSRMQPLNRLAQRM